MSSGGSAANARCLTCFVSHVRVDLCSDLPEVMRGLRAVWSGASRPLLPTTRHETLSTRTTAEEFQVCLGANVVAHTQERQDVLPLFETELYRALRTWHAELTLLHAGCVATDNKMLLLLGASGAGKSSLARAAVRRGDRYASDELTVCDGRFIWGIPRAIQFDVLRAGAAPPAWLAGSDVEAYRMRAFGDAGGALPIVRLAPAQIISEPLPVDRVCVVVLHRAARLQLVPLPAMLRLQALHEANLSGNTLALPALARAQCGYALDWSDPDEALVLLERSCS